MSRRSSSRGVSITLFPFLAVLVCVMGSLIFLLLATTKQLRDKALAAAEAAQYESLPEPPALLEELLPSELEAVPDSDVTAPEVALGTPFELEPLQPVEPTGPTPEELAWEDHRRQLAQAYRDQLAELERRRDQLRAAWKEQQAEQRAVKASVTELEETVGQSETRLRGVLAQLGQQNLSDSATEDLAQLEQQIIDLRQKLRQLQNRPSEEETKYAVVPFDARSGTTRRPILIECTDRGLRFLPEDIVITPADLEGFSDRYNPLLSGATALISFWTAWNQIQPDPDKEPEPYVLLLVRPDGTVAYYVAMKMLSSLKQPFGYELVDDAVQLQPPPGDPRATKACREAIEELLAERAEVQQHVRDGFRSGRGFTGDSSKPASDKFEVADVLPPSNEVGERSWENIDRFEGRKAPGTMPEPSPRSTGSSAPPRGRNAPTASTNPPSSPEQRPPAGQPSGKAVAQTMPARREFDSDAEPESSAARSRRDANPSEESPPALHRQPTRKPSSRGTHDRQAELRLEQLARRHWGDSEPNASIGIEKDVTIRIDAQQVLVAEDRPVRYQPGEQPLTVFLKLIETVDAEAQTWGKPRPGYYWTPRLRFVISPGGNQLYERINPLTVRSGLSTTQEFTLEGIRPAAQEVTP